MTTPGRVAGVLLAAGQGRRMGVAKARLPVDGRPLVERGIGTLVAGGCDEVLVVIGAERAEVLATASLAPARVVDNPGWREGVGSSLRRALDAAERLDVDAVVVMLVDEPDVGEVAVRRVLEAWHAGATVAVATYDGAPGHPVVLGRGSFGPVRDAAVGDVGARGYLRARPDVVTEVPCEDVADATDLDAPEDVRKRAARRRQA